MTTNTAEKIASSTLETLTDKARAMFPGATFKSKSDGSMTGEYFDPATGETLEVRISSTTSSEVKPGIFSRALGLIKRNPVRTGLIVAGGVVIGYVAYRMIRNGNADLIADAASNIGQGSAASAGVTGEMLAEGFETLGNVVSMFGRR